MHYSLCTHGEYMKCSRLLRQCSGGVWHLPRLPGARPENPPPGRLQVWGAAENGDTHSQGRCLRDVPPSTPKADRRQGSFIWAKKKRNRTQAVLFRRNQKCPLYFVIEFPESAGRVERHRIHRSPVICSFLPLHSCYHQLTNYAVDSFLVQHLPTGP